MVLDIDFRIEKRNGAVVPHACALIGSTINNGTSSFKAQDPGTHCWFLYARRPLWREQQFATETQLKETSNWSDKLMNKVK